MKNKLFIISTLLLTLGLTGCNNQGGSSSSEIISSNSSVDNRTAKQKVLDVCDIIIENSKDVKLLSSSQVMSGKITLTSMNSTTYIYESTIFELDELKLSSQSDVTENNTKSKYEINGKYLINHTEEYLGSEEIEQELNNYSKQSNLDEKVMIIGEDIYCDFSDALIEYFTQENIDASKDLKFKQIGLGSIIENSIKENYPDLDLSNTEIPEINPNELLEEFIGDDSLFNEYLKYEDKNGLKLKLVLNPADFYQLISDILLEADPESTIPIGTIFQMDTGNITLTFNFTSDDIESMDVSINGTFNVLIDHYTLNMKLDGKVVNEDIDLFKALDDYQNFVNFIDAGIDIEQLINDSLGNLDFDIEDKIPEI